MAEQAGLTKQRVFTEIVKSPHGKLTDYVEIGKSAIQSEGLFFQHLISWDRLNGQIRDSKVALPCVGIAFEKNEDLAENSYAHLAKLNPREFLKGYKFLRELRPKGKGLQIDRFVTSYLHEKESDRSWDHIAVQHHSVLKSLYSLSRTAPSNRHVAAVLCGQWKEMVGDKWITTKLDLPKGSIFAAVRDLKKMSPIEAAGTITKMRIPFLIALGALEEKAKDVDLLLALIERMSSTELTTNIKMLEKLGIKTNPALRGAFEKAMEKASTSKQNTLKTTQAVEAPMQRR